MVGVLRPGDVDGDIQLLLDMPLPYTAHALDDATLLALVADDFEHLLATSLPIARRWLSSVAGRLAASQTRLLGLLGRTSPNRSPGCCSTKPSMGRSRCPSERWPRCSARNAPR